MALAELTSLVNFVSSGVAKYQKVAADLEAAKAEMAAKVAAAELKAKKAAERAAVA